MQFLLDVFVSPHESSVINKMCNLLWPTSDIELQAIKQENCTHAQFPIFSKRWILSIKKFNQINLIIMVSGIKNHHSLVLNCTDVPSAVVLMNTNQHSVKLHLKYLRAPSFDHRYLLFIWIIFLTFYYATEP